MTSCSGKKVFHRVLLPALFCKACDLVPTLASKKGGGEGKDRYKRRRGLQTPHFLSGGQGGRGEDFSGTLRLHLPTSAEGGRKAPGTVSSPP